MVPTFLVRVHVVTDGFLSAAKNIALEVPVVNPK